MLKSIIKIKKLLLLAIIFFQFYGVFAQDETYHKLDSLINSVIGVNDSSTLNLIYNKGKLGWNKKDVIVLKKAGTVLEEFGRMSNSQELKAKANHCIGMAFSLSHQYEKAFFYLFASLRICEQFALNSIGVSVSNVLSYNYFNINNYPKAILYAQKSIDFLNKNNLNKSIYYVDSYRIIGEAYLQLNKPDLGKSYYLKALDYAILDKDSQGIEYIYYSISDVYLKEIHIDSAAYFINKALLIANDIHDSSFYQYIYQSMASIELQKKNYDQCLKYLTKAFQVNAQFKDLALKIEIMNVLTQYYKARKDYYNAYLHSQIANKLTDSLHSIEVNKKVIELETLFESSKATAKIAELNNLNRLNNLKIKTEKREKNALLIVLFISILAVMTIGYVLFQKNKLAKRLYKLNKEKTEMMGILSHDLRSPLTKIHALNAVLIQQNVLSQHKSTFNRINDIIKEATELIQNLLDISMADQKQTNLYIEQIDIIDELLLLREEYAQMALRKEIIVNIDFESNDLIVSTDRMKLKRILDNLLSNAIKYSPLKSAVNVRVIGLYNQIQFFFIDNGIGLSDKEQTEVFNKFPNLSTKPTMGEPATGMGLFITKQLVTMLNGEIEILSRKFEGTTFIVKLPKNYCK